MGLRRCNDDGNEMVSDNRDEMVRDGERWFRGLLFVCNFRELRSQKSTPAVTLTPAQKQHQFKNCKRNNSSLRQQQRSKQSEIQPQATTKKQSKEKSRKKTLRLCLASYGGSSASYSVLPFKSIGSSNQSSQLQKIQFPSSDGDCFGMACGVVGSNLYFCGGQRRQQESSNSDTKGKPAAPLSSYPRYSLHDYNPKVFTLDLANSANSETIEASEVDVFADQKKKKSEVDVMFSGMASPLIIVVERKLYVLAGTPVSMLPECPFVVLNSETNTWEKLPSPPFLTPDSKFFQDPQFRAYVVIGKKIHVSTSSSSFTFDTAAKEWAPCTFFGVDHHLDIRYPTHFEWMTYPLTNDKDKQGSGFPFDFDGGAVMYDEDVLICFVPSKGVVAYELVDGKVINPEVLKRLKIPLHVTFAYLADFGKGSFDLLTVSNVDQPKQHCQICIGSFQVSKVKSGLRKIKFSEVKKLTPPTEQLPADKIWRPIGCFVV
ncbi:hypothetical protein CsSME_00029922 [Camellia sinensis var. sinensis]